MYWFRRTFPRPWVHQGSGLAFHAIARRFASWAVPPPGLPGTMMTARPSRRAIAGSRGRMLALAGAAALAITAVAAVAPAGPAARAAVINAPVITVAGGNSVIAVQTSGDGLRFYWNEFGTSIWRGEPVAADGTTFSEPSIAQVGNTGAVNIAAEGTGRSLDYYWARNGTTTWHPEVAAAAGSIDSAPALSAHDGFANIVALNGNGFGSVFYWAANGTTTWTPSAMAGGDTSASSIVAYPGSPGGVHVVARDLFGTLAEETDVNGSGTWQYTAACSGGPTFPGCATTVPSVTMNDGSVNIADEDTYGNLDFYWQDSSGNFHQELVDTAPDL
jgi:hypothetical protein